MGKVSLIWINNSSLSSYLIILLMNFIKIINIINL